MDAVLKTYLKNAKINWLERSSTRAQGVKIDGEARDILTLDFPDATTAALFAARCHRIKEINNQLLVIQGSSIGVIVDEHGATKIGGLYEPSVEVQLNAALQGHSPITESYDPHHAQMVIICRKDGQPIEVGDSMIKAFFGKTIQTKNVAFPYPT